MIDPTSFSIGYLITSLIAGFITVLAPCILPLLPVVVGSGAGAKRLVQPLRIIASLAASIIVFTLLLKASTALLGIDPIVWALISGGILIIMGLLTIFPDIWEKIVVALPLGSNGNKLLGKGVTRGGPVGDVMIGAALGPVFTSCSPTFAAIAGTILPASYGVGMTYLLAYVLGLSIPLALIAIFGQRLAGKLTSLSDPRGWFKRIIGILFVMVGVAIIMGWDKDLEAFLIREGYYNWVTDLEAWFERTLGN